MPTYDVVILPGDGIGRDVMAEGEKVLRAAAGAFGLSFKTETVPCGGQYYLEHGRDWPEGAEERCRKADVVFLGAVGWPDPKGGGPVLMKDGKMAGYSPVIGLRTGLDLYANVRPVKLYPGVGHRIHGAHKQVWDADKVDMVFVRENTEGLYAGMGGILAPGRREKVAVDTRVITREGAERVIRFAYELARKRGRGAPKDGKKRVTCVVKDNVLKGCQFFARVFREVGKEYPEIEQETAIVDAFTQWLITGPEHYNVIVTTNMFGDIVTDLASVLQGGMGMAVGCNVGDNHAMFEPIHGSAPKYTGLDKANPLATILTVAEGLRWLGDRKSDKALRAAGDAIEKAVTDLVAEGKTLTYDLVGEKRASTTRQVGDAVCARLQAARGAKPAAKADKRASKR